MRIPVNSGKYIKKRHILVATLPMSSPMEDQPRSLGSYFSTRSRGNVVGLRRQTKLVRGTDRPKIAPEGSLQPYPVKKRSIVLIIYIIHFLYSSRLEAIGRQQDNYFCFQSFKRRESYQRAISLEQFDSQKNNIKEKQKEIHRGDRDTMIKFPSYNDISIFSQ